MITSTIRAVEPGKVLPALDREPFINPKIVNALSSWVSDSGDQIVAINIDESQNSNLFFRNRESEDGLSYSYIGRTDSGVHVVQTFDGSGGGSAGWVNLLFLVIEYDLGLQIPESDGKATMTRPGRLLKKLGDTFLGDRWKGQIMVEGNKVYIGKDHNWRVGGDDLEMGVIVKLTNDWKRVIEIEYPGPFLFPGQPLPTHVAP